MKNYKNWEQGDIFDDMVGNSNIKGCEECLNYNLVSSDDEVYDYCIFYDKILGLKQLDFWKRNKCIGFDSLEKYNGRKLNRDMERLSKINRLLDSL